MMMSQTVQEYRVKNRDTPTNGRYWKHHLPSSLRYRCACDNVSDRESLLHYFSLLH